MMAFADQDFQRYLLEARENAKEMPSRQFAGTFPRRFPESEVFVPLECLFQPRVNVGNFPARTFTEGWRDRFKSPLAISVHRAITHKGDE